MKVFRFNGGRIGVANQEGWFDVTDSYGVNPASWPPVQMVQFIADFDSCIKNLLAHADTKPIDAESIRLDVPLEWPNKLLAYPVNYVKHGEEMKSTNRADRNGFFMKANSSLSGPNDPIVLPEIPGREIHHECELGIVIGKKGKNISREEAFDYIFGYACLIDMVVRGKEERVMRKSYDSFCPFGPWIVTADEVPNPSNIQARLWVNDVLKQDANTKDLIVDIPEMIQTASRVATLYPGDIIATGTPEGVGPVNRGDRVRIAIENVGEMTLQVK
ncbi:fumarylacetoacetate hydrolase family protein [Pusillimonas sp. DMV24BSW_D]|uniref:fumarylacetoacetate hydrolase family protein n=1 Tax=Neopusillimonas aestuarii TaxID=2716226 RepID=UPI00140B9130|nr:fumarylacetoacetate hydrolase family protein [Pusillimonas sp. DMV24BSW_D]QIM48072.1 fumarylacetoacetate hydrolase family protein [Pusillimonas sp. DMV24BSW_D]